MKSKVSYLRNIVGRPAFESLRHTALIGGILDGSLPASRFHELHRQDHLYLLTYTSIVDGLKPRMQSLSSQGYRYFGVFVEETHSELQNQQAMLEVSGSTQPNAACAAYMNHLLTTARYCDVATILAALSPCVSFFQYLRDYINQQNLLANNDHPYADWLRACASANDRHLSFVFEEVCETLGTEAATLEWAYRQSLYHEHQFYLSIMNQAEKPTCQELVKL